MKLADEVIKIHEVIAGVAGELTTSDDGHKHEITVDNNGNGKTTSVLNHSNEPIDQKNQEDKWGQKNHTHIIKDGVVQDHVKEYEDGRGKKYKLVHTHKPSAKG